MSSLAERNLGARGGRLLPALVLACWAVGLILPGLARAATGAHRVAAYQHWEGAHYLIAEDLNLIAVVIPQIGGRVLFYGFSGDNILFEDPTVSGKTLATLERGSFGGYQLDIGPELRGISAHPQLWAGVYHASSPSPYQVRVSSPPESELGLRLEKEFTMDPDSGRLGVTQTVKNTGSTPVSYCLWDRTLCVNGGYAIIPLNRKSRFPAKWSIRTGKPGSWQYDGVTPASSRAKVLDGMLIVEARGEATKIGADSDAGWIAYVKGNLLFVKSFPYEPGGRYTDGGNSVEFYWDERVAELEPLSPEKQLAPGESYVFPEQWSLVRLNEPVTGHREARKAAKRVEPFRFSTSR